MADFRLATKHKLDLNGEFNVRFVFLRDSFSTDYETSEFHRNRTPLNSVHWFSSMLHKGDSTEDFDSFLIERKTNPANFRCSSKNKFDLRRFVRISTWSRRFSTSSWIVWFSREISSISFSGKRTSFSSSFVLFVHVVFVTSRILRIVLFFAK